MEQMTLPLPRGPMVSMSVSMHRVMDRGWDLEVWHRHWGEATNCAARWHYWDLSTAEAATVLEALVAPGNGPYHGDGDDCVPGPPPRP